MCPHVILVILCLELSVLVIYAVRWPGCSCVTYDSQHRSEGIFQSPNYPNKYPPKIDCILYTFKGEIDEIVEISFREFDLRTKSPIRCSDRNTADYLRLFLDLDRPEVNEKTNFSKVLCGNISMIQKDYYSSKRIIMMEFQSGDGAGKNAGFRGRYRFLAADQFKQDCMKIGPGCKYMCNSSLTKSGKFFSEGYPQNYKSKTQCHYYFRGTPRERVKIKFNNIQLGHNDGSCHIGHNDKVIIHDGPNQQSTVISELCNDGNNIEFESSSQDIYVHFNAMGSHPRKGFAAEFEFLPIPSTITPTPSNATDFANNISNPSQEPQISSTTPGPNECPRVFNSAIEKEGTFCPSDYPGYRTKVQQCIYSFSGSGKQKVQLSFTGFQPDANLKCDQEKVELFANIEGEKEHLGTYCKSPKAEDIPTTVMSHNNKLEMRYTSAADTEDSNVKPEDICFHYKFRTDNGLQCDYILNDTACGCEFRSERAMNGTFSSPNYPGIYPRQTECHYKFYGRPKERVTITFNSFDIDGVANSCKDPTVKADYVEFSDFIPPDKARTPQCGSRPEDMPDPVTSDAEFFRMMFKSNDVYDGKGFEATYEFFSDDHTDPPPSTGVLCQGTVNYYIIMAAVTASVLYN